MSGKARNTPATSTPEAPSVTYGCEGCGYTVHWFGRTEPPPHRMCAICVWLCEHGPPEGLMELRRRLEPGGWESERQRRNYVR